MLLISKFYIQQTFDYTSTLTKKIHAKHPTTNKQTSRKELIQHLDYITVITNHYPILGNSLIPQFLIFILRRLHTTANTPPPPSSFPRSTSYCSFIDAKEATKDST